MISYIASCIVDMLIHNHAVDTEDAPVYQYGFEFLLSSLITFAITITAGLLLKSFAAAMIYFFLFVTLRSICGGYHAQTYFQCNLIFTIVTFSVLLMYKQIAVKMFVPMHYYMLLFSVIVAFAYVPVENENKPLSQKQKKVSRVLGIAMMLILSLISCLLEIKFQSSYSILIDATLFAVAISMFVTEPMRGG